MLTTLIESRAVREQTFRAQMVSVALHATVICAAVIATQGAAAVIERAEDHPPPIYVRTVVTPEPRPAIPSINLARLKGFHLLPTIVRIPDLLPDIDLLRNLFLTNPDEYLGARGQPGGDPYGVATTTGVGVMTADQVDRPAHLLPGSGRPSYPESLRSAGLSGEVTVQFVIDTTGRADVSTISIIASTHALFTGSVKRALEKARFAPAEFAGRKVRQVVRMPFVFSLEK